MENFKVLGKVPLEIIDDAKLKTISISDDDWRSFRDSLSFYFETLTNINPLVIYNQPDRDNPVYSKKIVNEYFLLQFDELLNYLRKIVISLYPDGEFKRILLHKLLAGKNISRHQDGGHHLVASKRIHVPIITNDEVDFIVNDEVVNMKYGDIVEINNNLPHEVLNNSNSDRVHLIVDWNSTHDSHYFDYD